MFVLLINLNQYFPVSALSIDLELSTSILRNIDNTFSLKSSDNPYIYFFWYILLKICNYLSNFCLININYFNFFFIFLFFF